MVVWRCIGCFHDFDSATIEPRRVHTEVYCPKCANERFVTFFERALEHENDFPPPYGGALRLEIRDFRDVLDPAFVQRYLEQEECYRVPRLDRRFCRHMVLVQGTKRRELCSAQLHPRALATGQDFPCRKCAQLICGKCEGPKHEVHACETAEERQARVRKEEEDRMAHFKGLERGKAWQHCPAPKCAFPVELSDACNHMTCPLWFCKTQFCRICGEVADSESGHWGTRPGQCRRYLYPGHPRYEKDSVQDVPVEDLEDLEDLEDMEEEEDGVDDTRRNLLELETNNRNPAPDLVARHPDDALEFNEEKAERLEKTPQVEFAWIRPEGEGFGLLRMHISVFFSYADRYLARQDIWVPLWIRDNIGIEGLISFRVSFAQRTNIVDVQIGRRDTTPLELISDASHNFLMEQIHGTQQAWFARHLRPLIDFIQNDSRSEIAFHLRAPTFPPAFVPTPIVAVRANTQDLGIPTWTFLQTSTSPGFQRDVIVALEDFLVTYRLLVRWENEPCPLALEKRDFWDSTAYLRIALSVNANNRITKAKLVTAFEGPRVRARTIALMPHVEQALFGHTGTADFLTPIMRHWAKDSNLLYLGRAEDPPNWFPALDIA